MWFLIVSVCTTIGGSPACFSELYPAAMLTPTACEDAALTTHDYIREAAAADGLAILSLDTVCFNTADMRAADGGLE